jgi:hypothetical protein
MCITEKNHHVFHSFDYTLTLHLSKSGGVTGFLTISSDHNATKYPLWGCYVSHNNSVQCTFSVDWSFPDRENWGFTLFSGHFVTDLILVVDWMLVDNKRGDQFGITGSDFLYSSSLSVKERRKLPTDISPFPINLELYERSYLN